MKRISLLLALTCLFLAATAQRQVKGRQFLNDKCQSFYLTPFYRTKDINIAPAIKHLEVVDFRPDTSRMGFLTENRKWKDIRFRAGLRHEVQAYLKDQYAFTGGIRSLLIIIKKCWLSDTAVARPTMELMKYPGKGRIAFRAEAFLKTPEGYAPYTYLDTVISSNASAVNIARKRLEDLLEILMDKVAATDEAAVIKRNRFFSFDALDSLNKRRFAYAMDTALTLRKGVYASLEEFRNNNPSIHNYEVQQNKEGHLDLFLKDEEGKLYYSRKMWGYCDGENCYAMMDGNLFPVVQADNAYYVCGSRQYKVEQTRMPLFVVFPTAFLLTSESISETVLRKLSLFQLDMHTGQID
jgi:hypothetical protein